MDRVLGYDLSVMLQPPAPKSDFVGLDEQGVYLATGGQSPLLERHRDAFERFMTNKAGGELGFLAHDAVTTDARGLVGRLTGLPAGDNVFVGNASEGIARVIASIDWRDGDNVVVSQKDYASGLASLV